MPDVTMSSVSHTPHRECADMKASHVGRPRSDAGPFAFAISSILMALAGCAPADTPVGPGDDESTVATPGPATNPPSDTGAGPGGDSDLASPNDSTDVFLPAGQPAPQDPGAAPWQLVPLNRVAEDCKLDPKVLVEVAKRSKYPFAVVRYGKLCFEHYLLGRPDRAQEVWSASKSFGAVVVGAVSYQTRNIGRTGPGTGPFRDSDRAHDWLDPVNKLRYTYRRDALVAHVLAMAARSTSFEYGSRRFEYDIFGTRQINSLSNMMANAIKQDEGRLGVNLEEFNQRFVSQPLGLTDSKWSPESDVDKTIAYGWKTTVRDMARVGLLILHKGMWSGQRILDTQWTYRMTHTAFEDANTAYGYLTWVGTRSNYKDQYNRPGPDIGPEACAPVALHDHYPSSLSGAPDCNYSGKFPCTQEYDQGGWFFGGLGGQYIVGQPGLDLLMVAKNMGTTSGAGPAQLWDWIRPAVVAMDPRFRGDEQAFCKAYGSNAYAPDLIP